MSDHKPKYFQYIIAGVLIVVGIILITSILKTEDVAILPDAQEVLDETTRVVEATNYEYIMPEEWEFYENAIEDIQSLSEYQEIEFGVVQDPIEPNFVYFASRKTLLELGDTLLSLYKYNEDDYSFDRLWRRDINNVDEYGIDGTDQYFPVMHVIGYENGKLIVLFQSGDDSPGPCANPWLMGWEDRANRNMMTINLSDPYNGFEEYTPSDEIIETAEDAVDECETALFQ
ncbi:hypothetical protein HN358_05350 [Candidatus Uhrbacteria bacterium]|jgi:hypothetical protein|nr:hypothetical protein [Candidatus Uhrbacteria bacterium]MBT7716813.1 hypothetical protein [Candidatus Uhrbacteria bacterium]